LPNAEIISIISDANSLYFYAKFAVLKAKSATNVNDVTLKIT